MIIFVVIDWTDLKRACDGTHKRKDSNKVYLGNIRNWDTYMTHFPPKCQEIWHFWNTSENLKPWPKSIRPDQSVSQSNQTINPNDHLSSWQLTWPNWSICLNQSIHQAQPVHSTCNLSSVYHFIKSVHHSFQKGHPHLLLAQHSHTESGWYILENNYQSFNERWSVFQWNNPFLITGLWLEKA